MTLRGSEVSFTRLGTPRPDPYGVCSLRVACRPDLEPSVLSPGTWTGTPSSVEVPGGVTRLVKGKRTGPSSGA